MSVIKLVENFCTSQARNLIRDSLQYHGEECILLQMYHSGDSQPKCYNCSDDVYPEGVRTPSNCVNPAHLRVATNKQQHENKGPQRNNKTGVRGVSSAGNGKWRARAKHNGREYSAGHFDTIAEAEAAVIALRNRLFTHNDADR